VVNSAIEQRRAKNHADHATACRSLNPAKEKDMRSILLLVLGVPIPIVILIGLFSHF
jgi:hypothetical protein